MSIRVTIETFGCRTNVADSSLLGEALVAAGATLVHDPHQTDVLVVNGCTVTHGADRDAGKIMRRYRRHNPHLRTILCGCLPAAYPEHRVTREADVVVPGLAPEAVVAAALGIAEPIPVGTRTFIYEKSRTLTRANIKIQEGCDNYCAYCIVPTARGKPRSRTMAEVLAEVEAALAAGYQELVLTGTHLARYGRDLGPQENLLALMARLEDYAGSCRFRLSSLEIEPDMEPVAERIAGHDIWCRHLHLALQHPTDEILHDMGRRYRSADARRLLEHVAALLPDAAVGLDVIVGYPAEDDALFARGAEALAEWPFRYLHVFAYSPRPGTRAATRKPLADSRTVKARSATLRTMAESRLRDFVAGQLGSRREVLVERRRDRRGRLVALTDNYLRGVLEGPDSWMGERKMVRLSRTDGETLTLEESGDGMA